MSFEMLKFDRRFNAEEGEKILRVYEEGILENARELYENTDYAEAIRRERKAFLSFFDKFLTLPGNSYWVLAEGGDWVSALRLSEVKPRVFYLEALESRPDKRRQGCALRLLEGVFENLKRQGPFRIGDCVHKKNAASLRIHEKAGFRIVSDEGISYLDGSRSSWEYSLLYEWNETGYVFPSVRERSIRKASEADFEPMMAIYRQAQDFMIQAGNPDQWAHRHPAPELIRRDIDGGIAHLIIEDGVIRGVFTLLTDEDPAYNRIEDGSWPNTKPYVTIHRVAGDGKTRSIFHSAAEYAKSLSDEVRVDTHEKNAPMRRAIEREGFSRCGIVYMADGTPRIAYQWSRKPSP